MAQLDPEAMVEIIAEYLGNPFDNRSVPVFCKESNFAVQSYYNHYNKNKDRIDYKAEGIRKRYMNHVKSTAMKSLVGRMQKSDKLLQIALEVTGLYTPKTEVNQTVVDETQKKARLEALLDKLGKKNYSEIKKADLSSDQEIIDNNQP